MDRRDFLLGAAGLWGVTAVQARNLLPLGSEIGTLQQEPMQGLKTAARKKGLFFGCAVGGAQIKKESVANEIIRDCNLVVGENSQKWSVMWKNISGEDPSAADELARFAFKNNILLRGHALIYQSKLPPWVSELDDRKLKSAFERRIRYACSRWKGRVHSWDVVNEAIAQDTRRDGDLRSGVFLDRLGAGYISEAFHLAKECDPEAMLCYNDYGFESASPDARRRRVVVLRMLEGLKAKSVPVEALGIQSHLTTGANYQDKEWRSFLSEVASLGLKIIVSELDVSDRTYNGDTEARDKKTAGIVKRYLDVTLDERQVCGVVTWGLDDGSSWMNWRGESGDRRYQRADGAPMRPLQLDSDLNRKPMWYALESALNGSPDRT